MSEPIAPIIHRLMREMEDGSFKIEGYQKLEGGQIYVGVHQDLRNACPMISKRTNPRLGAPRWIVNCWIPHDRRDRWTGVTLNDEAKTKVFERDIIECEIDDSDLLGRGQSGFKKHTETIRSRPMFDTEYVTGGPDGCTKLINIKIVGIEGVHKTEERGKA